MYYVVYVFSSPLALLAPFLKNIIKINKILIIILSAEEIPEIKVANKHK